MKVRSANVEYYVHYDLVEQQPITLPTCYDGCMIITNYNILIIQAWVQFGVPLDESGEIIERLLAAAEDEELSDVAFEALSSMVIQ